MIEHVSRAISRGSSRIEASEIFLRILHETFSSRLPHKEGTSHAEKNRPLD